MNATNRFHPLRMVALLLALLLCSVPLSAQDYTVNLNDTDIQELIKFVAEATGKTIVVDPSVKGKVKVISSKPVSAGELYELFLSILDVHGYAAVGSGDVVRVIQNKDARSAPAGVSDGRSETTSEQYVTQVLRLENISAAKLIPVLRPLVPQQAHMAAYAPSNAIIISDISANIDKIRDIIERMDKSAVQQTDVVKLRYAVAEDVVKMLTELNKTAAAQEAGEQQTLLVADTRTNSVLISGDELERARLRQLVDHLDTPLEQSGNVKVIYLEYADAVAIAEVLTRVMKNMSELGTAEGGAAAGRTGSNTSTIEADEGTNSLIITADADEMAALEAVIHRLDIRRAQVLVEAIIVEMEVIDGQDLGLQWLFASSNGSFGSNINSSDARARNIAEAVLPGDDDNGDPQDASLGALAGALAGTPGLSLGWGQLDDNLNMAVILSALKETKNANILSTPSLLTLDNQEAFITVGQNVPFVTGSFTNSGGGDGAQNPFQTIQRENVGITLKVTPHINEGDSVVLDISQEVSSLSGLSVTQTASDIITNERKIETKVLAIDGRVVVLGGLIKDDVQDAQQKVPFLGDIPYLGRLFRSDGEKVTKQNLMVFIRTTIIRDNAALVGASAEKYRYIRDQQALHKDKGLTYLDSADVPMLDEWEDDLKQLQTIQADESGAYGPGAPAPPVDGR